MDLLLIGGGIFLLYWLGTSAGAQAPGTTGPGGTGLVPSVTPSVTPVSGVLQDIGRVMGQVSTAASIGKTVLSAPSQISKAVSALVGPGAPSPPTAEFSLFTQGPLPQEILPADLVDATEFIPSAEQGLTAGADLVIPEVAESIVPIAGEEVGAGIATGFGAGEEAASVLGIDIASGFGAGEEAASVLGTGAATLEETGVISGVLTAVAPFAYGLAALSVPLIAMIASGGLKEMTTPPEDAMKHDFAVALQDVQRFGGWDATLRLGTLANVQGTDLSNPLDRITGYYLTTSEGSSGAYVPIESFPPALIPQIEAYIPTYLAHVHAYEAMQAAAQVIVERYP